MAATGTVVGNDRQPVHAERAVIAREAPERVRLTPDPGAETVVAVESAPVVRRHRNYFKFNRAVTVIVVSPDGRYLASGHDDGTLRVWDAHTQRGLCGREAHVIRVRSLAWSHDSSRLATAGGRKVRVWDVATGERRFVATRDMVDTSDVEFGPCGQLLASERYTWDLHTGDVLRAPPVVSDHSEEDFDEAFGEDESGLSDAPFEGPTTNAPIGLGSSRTIVAPSGGWCVRIRSASIAIASTTTGHVLATIRTDAGAVAVSADNRFIYTTDDKTIRVWDGWSGAPRGKLEVPARPHCLTASADHVWVACDDGSIRRFRAP